MGKKSKANKLAKMSEEERARYMQMRADIEEETRRRKVQLLTLFMKNKLKREDAFCRLNMAKINQEWRSMLRQMKVQGLRKEMLELQQFFKEALERKDRVIKRLLGDLDVAEDMYATLQQSHMETVNRLIGTQQQRIQFFKDIYESEKAAVLQEYEKDVGDFEQLRDRAQEELECVKCQLEDYSTKVLQERYERHLLRLDDLKSEMQIYIEKITQSGEAKLERLWQEYQDVLAGYMSHTEGFYAEYMDLKERDEESTAVIREHCNEIEKATDQLAHLKLVYADTADHNAVSVGHLVKMRTDLRTRLAALKVRVDQQIKEDETRFKVMSVAGYKALKDLKKCVSKGETLLQLAVVCSKLETERERMLPLGLPPLPRQVFAETPPEEEQAEQVPAEMQEHNFGNWLQMENFWRRVNNATVDVASLKQQKSALEAENARLKMALQEYLMHLSLSNGSNLHINDYLAKRPSSMRVQHVQQLELESKEKCQSAHERRSSLALQPITACIEANFTNAVRTAQLLRGKPKLAKIEAIVRW